MNAALVNAVDTGGDVVDDDDSADNGAHGFMCVFRVRESTCLRLPNGEAINSSGAGGFF